MLIPVDLFRAGCEPGAVALVILSSLPLAQSQLVLGRLNIQNDAAGCIHFLPWVRGQSVTRVGERNSDREHKSLGLKMRLEN